MYRIVCSNPYSVDKSVDIEDDDDDEEVSEIDWHFITCQAGLGISGLFFSIVSNFALSQIVTNSNKYELIIVDDGHFGFC